MFEYLHPDAAGGVWMSREAWVYYAPAGQPPRPAYDHEVGVTSLAVTAAGDYVASGDQDGTILIYGTRERRYAGCIRTWGGWVTALSWDLDGEMLVSVSMEHGQAALEHWRLPEERLALHLNWPWDWWEHTWAPGGQAVAWVGKDGEEGHVLVYHFATALITALERTAQRSMPLDLAWSPDSHSLAVNDGKWLEIWNPASSTRRAREETQGIVTGLAFLAPNLLVTAESRDWTTTHPTGWLQEWHLSAAGDLLIGRAWCEEPRW